MRTSKNGQGIILQKEAIPWEEIKPGMVLMNYGHAYHLQIYFVEAVRKNSFISTYLEVREMGDLTLHEGRIVGRESWEYWGDKFNGDIYNIEATLYDEYRTEHLRDLMSQVFTTGIRLSVYNQ